MDSGHIDVDALQQELEMKYRRELNSKLEEVNSYLETQARARDHLDNSRSENETRLAADKQRLEVLLFLTQFVLFCFNPEVTLYCQQDIEIQSLTNSLLCSLVHRHSNYE